MATPRPPEQLMRTYLTEVAQGERFDLLHELAHPDMVDEANQIFGGPPGVAGLVAHVKGFNRHVADAELTIVQITGGDQSVMAWWTFEGVHVGPWLGVDPTNERISGTVFSFFDLVDGRISRYRLWLHADFGARRVVFDSSSGQLPA